VPLSMTIAPAEGTDELAVMLACADHGRGLLQRRAVETPSDGLHARGIFLAGMAHYPKFTEESISHALAAAARGADAALAGIIVSGRVVAVVDPKKCVGCLTCTRTCPFSIPQIIKQEGDRSGRSRRRGVHRPGAVPGLRHVHGRMSATRSSWSTTRMSR